MAYFSSIALLGLAAVQPPSPSGMGDNTTYFDSVVFLTIFLLAGMFSLLLVKDHVTHGVILSGRCLEAYSKARTADAISALSLLRPTEALLLSLVVSSDDASTSDFSHNDDLEKGIADSRDEAFSTKPGFKVEKIDVGLLEVGDIVRIQSGATPPADATIVSGADSTFDESSLTGESKLIKKSQGDKVFLGTINKGQMVDAKIAAIGGATM